MDAVEESPGLGIVPYYKECLLLKNCARLLRLPSRAIVTSLVYLHKYRQSELGRLDSDKSCTPQLLVAACIFLSSKVEEVSVSNNHLLNAVKLVADLFPLGQLSDFLDLAPGNHHDSLVTENISLENNLSSKSFLGKVDQKAAQVELLVGQTYYDAKAELLRMEQKLLRILRFQLCHEQPYTFMFNVCHTVGAPAALVAAAVAMLNDVVTLSALIITVPAFQLSVCVIHVTSLLLGCEDSFPAGPMVMNGDGAMQRIPWYEAVGVSAARVEEVGKSILEVLEAAKAQTAGLVNHGYVCEQALAPQAPSPKPPSPHGGSSSYPQ